MDFILQQIYQRLQKLLANNDMGEAWTIDFIDFAASFL